jgi:hypothetical protein
MQKKHTSIFRAISRETFEVIFLFDSYIKNVVIISLKILHFVSIFKCNLQFILFEMNYREHILKLVKK